MDGACPAGLVDHAQHHVNASLTKLDLSYNGIDCEVEEALREAVKGREGFDLHVVFETD